jgi:chorismate mutase
MTSSPDTDAAAATPPPPPLGALRAEIDALDDAMHDLLRRRAEVVARLAGSRAKGDAPTLRPGREAQVLRRLLTRHDGPLPPAAVVRLWRDVFAVSSGMQRPFTVAVQGGGGAPAAEHLAREHFGALTPLSLLPTPARALATLAAGEAAAAVLALPREDEPAEAAWWTGLDSPRLQVGARLPFWAPAGAEAEGEALVVLPGAPDPSGEDRSLLRLEARGAEIGGRAPLLSALAAVGLPARTLLVRRDGAAGGATLALAEVEGAVAAGDPRLADLGLDRVVPLGFYAVPLRGGGAG